MTPAVAVRVKSAPSLVGDSETVCHYVYLEGQPRWAGPAVRFFGELPDVKQVIDATRTDGRGRVPLLFDPDRVTVERATGSYLNASDTSGRDRRDDMHRRGTTDTAQIAAGRPHTSIAGNDQGDVISRRARTNGSHTSCDHEATRTARMACRRQRARDNAKNP